MRFIWTKYYTKYCANEQLEEVVPLNVGVGCYRTGVLLRNWWAYCQVGL